MRSFFVSLILGAIALPFFTYEGKVSAQIEGVSASFQQCLDRGVYYPYKNRIETQEILQKFEAEDGTYYMVQLFPIQSQDAWTVVVKDTPNGCSYIGDSFHELSAKYGDMEDSLVKRWAIQMLTARIDKFGKAEVRSQIKSAQIKWHPGEILAIEELGLN